VRGDKSPVINNLLVAWGGVDVSVGSVVPGMESAWGGERVGGVALGNETDLLTCIT
jgi:hypothetical protein